MRPRKTVRRVQIVDEIMAALCSKVVYGVLNSQVVSEDKIKTYLHQILRKHLEKIFKEIFCDTEELAEKHAIKSLLWEGDRNTTINNVIFLGTQHRPDFVIHIDGFSIAVEVKIGETGQSIREGLGQCLVYAASVFDFVCYLYVDSSKDKKVVSSLKVDREKDFLMELWEHYNIRFAVVS